MNAVAATEFLARSSTFTSVGWIGYIIIGALAGLRHGQMLQHKAQVIALAPYRRDKGR